MKEGAHTPEQRPTTPGTVYLVGAGPGDPDLITVRGLRLLEGAEVVAYDRLAAPELLDHVGGRAERIYVGKTPHRGGITQEQINHLLVTRARAGKSVVRLKGGDPFVFGRGGEEALALAEAGIPFEVVPGITSAVGVPAYAGIPVTHRKIASSFAVLTAHKCWGATESEWAALARLDTIVLLMGVSSLRSAVRHLLLAGRSANESAAIIENGTTARQRVVTSTLSEIPDALERAAIESPATTVVGKVVDLRADIAWFAERAVEERDDYADKLSSG
jgi:uroporphyrin-III C-methyltransferase